MPVGELKQRMTLAEFRAWQAYDRIDPLGRDRWDYLASMVAATILNVFRGRGSKPVVATDLMPRWGTPATKDTSGQLLGKIQALIARVNSSFS